MSGKSDLTNKRNEFLQQLVLELYVYVLYGACHLSCFVIILTGYVKYETNFPYGRKVPELQHLSHLFS